MAVRVDLHRAPVDRIRTMARDAPELAILAACIKQALEDAQAGDLEAAEWLASDWRCSRWRACPAASCLRRGG